MMSEYSQVNNLETPERGKKFHFILGVSWGTFVLIFSSSLHLIFET